MWVGGVGGFLVCTRKPHTCAFVCVRGSRIRVRLCVCVCARIRMRACVRACECVDLQMYRARIQVLRV